MSDGANNLPPNLSRAPTEFDKLCRDHGGPLPIRETVPRDTLASACGQFFFERTWDTFREWEGDRVKAMRLWPWVALAAELYSFERKERAAYTPEPTPTQLTNLLLSISKQARSLFENLAELESLANRLEDRDAPERREHIAYIQELIAQGLALPRREVDESPAAALAAHFAFRRFCLTLINVETVASAASRMSIPGRRKRSQEDQGLGGLVARASEIWTRMKGEAPKVPKRGSGTPPSYKPPFVRFITNIARLAGEREPTWDEIRTAWGAG